MQIDNEATPTPEQPTADPFADIAAMQNGDGVRDGADSAQRLFELESETNPVVEATNLDIATDADPAQSRLRLTPRGRAVGAAVVATAAVAAGSLVIPAAIDAAQEAKTESLLAKPTVTVSVQSGDGLQKLIEENVPQVASGQYDWRDVAGDIGHLPQNSKISEPGYVLMPGDTVVIPIYGSTESK